MNIRKRIVVSILLVFSAVYLAVAMFMYYEASIYRKEAFNEQLLDRLRVTEQFFLELDYLNPDEKISVRETFFRTLPQEIEYVSPYRTFNDSVSEDVAALLPDDFYSDVNKGKAIHWEIGNYQGVGQVFEINEAQSIVIVIAVDEVGYAFVNRLAKILLLAYFISLIIVAGVSFLFVGRMLKPISEKIKKANKISAKNLSVRLNVYNKNDELGLLAMSFNSLLDRLETAFNAQSSFIRHASHEIKNPLAVITGEIEWLTMADRTTGQYKESLKIVEARIDQMNLMLEKLLKLAELENTSIEMRELQLIDVLLKCVNDLNVLGKYGENRIDFDIDLRNGDAFEIKGDSDLLYIALYNIIENALKYSPHNTKVKITLRSSDKGIQVQIADEGIGIPKEQIERITEPLYRASNAPTGQGSGLGLSIVNKILIHHKGELSFNSKLEKGTTIDVFFKF